MKIRRILKSSLSFLLAMLFACSGGLATAANSYENMTREQSFEIITEKIIYNTPSKYGYSDYIITDKNGNEIEQQSDIALFSVTEDDIKSGELPESYDAREQGIITNAKHQGSSGSCWAFSATSCIETSAVKQQLYNDELDLSEAHLVYFTFNGLTGDKNSTIGGDGYSVSNPFMQGGNWLKAVSTYARWTGAELEEYAKFNSSRLSEMVYPEEIRSESYVRIDNAIKLNDKDSDAVKQAVIDYGSVSVAYNNDNSCFTNSAGKRCYYRGINDDSPANHGVTVIGWDDNYSRENFSESKRPSTDGAWLIKNSWGESWGENGCFWISYEEPSLKTFVVMQAQSKDKYDNNYQYDGAGYNLMVGLTNQKSLKTANIFTAKGSETLKAVSFYTLQDNLDYKVEIYTNVRSTPSDGRRVSTKSGYIPSQGYYTIELPDSIALSAGQKFSVVVTLTTKTEASVRVAAEGPSEGIYNFSSNKGESFLSQTNITNWLDCHENNLNNICIKAFTVGSDKSALSEAVESAEKYRQEDYTAASFAKFSAQLQNARQLLADKNASSADINNCIIRLNSLIAALNPSSLEISTAEEYMRFCALVNSGDDFDGVTVRLAADIDLSDAGKISAIGSGIHPFSGTFDGQQHTISGLTMYCAEGEACGLFGSISENAVIKNLKISDAVFAGDGDIGGICVRNAGRIENCSVNADVSSLNDNDGCIGMVSAISTGTISGCTVSGTVKSVGCAVGTIAGQVDSGKIENCSSTASVISSKGIAGGIAGIIDLSEISGCSYAGEIEASDMAGGISAQAVSSLINSCSFSGGISSTETVGGIMAECEDSTVINCSFAGKIASGLSAAGIAGVFSSGKIANCFAAGEIDSPNGAGIALGGNALPGQAFAENCCCEISCIAGGYADAVSDDISAQRCYFASDQDIENSVSPADMRTKLFAYTMNQGLAEGFTPWTQDDEQNDGLPYFGNEENAIMRRPCTVTLMDGDKAFSVIGRYESDQIELPEIENRDNSLFFGWMCGEKIYSGNLTVTGDMVLTALFRQITSIEIGNLPNNIALGKTIDFDGAVITAHFNDGYEQQYPADKAEIELLTLRVGENKGIVTFFGVSCEFALTLTEPQSDYFIKVGSVSGFAGDTVDVPVALEGCPDIKSMQIELLFDSSELSLQAVMPADEQHCTWSAEDGRCIIALSDDKSLDRNGLLASLIFRLSDEADAGEYSINITYDMKNIAGESKSIAPAVLSGVIEIKQRPAVIKGDVNGDGSIDLLDGVLLCRYLDDSFDDVEIDPAASDMDDNGIINEVDLAALRAMLLEG